MKALLRRLALVALTTLAALPATAGPGAGPESAPARLLRTVQLLEQVGIHPAHHDEFAAILDARMRHFSSLAVESFEKEAGIPVIDPPAGAGWSTVEVSRWLAALRARPKPARCDLLRLAYAVSISRLSLMKASLAEPPSFPIGSEQAASPEFATDTARALWELRYFWVIPPDAAWIPTDCADRTFPDFSILHEARARIDFLENGATTPKASFRRWPLGRAARMCGRPFVTHYADHLALRSASRGMDLRPIQMLGIEDAAEFSRRLRELE